MIERIAVVLPNWFGETLFATPFLKALRRAKPAAHIVAVGWPQCGELLLHNPDIQGFIPYAESRGLPAAAGLIRNLRRERIDTGFILRKSFSRTLLLKLAGVQRRIGFDHPKTRGLLTDRVEGPASGIHKAATYLALLNPLGSSAALEPYSYAVGPEERGRASAWLAKQGLGGDEPLVILHPGANWAHKRWPPEYFAALGDRLSEELGAAIAVTGSPDDAAIALTVQTHMRRPALVWAGELGIRDFAAVLTTARLLVAADTGVLHIAAAAGCPVVGLFAPTDPSYTGPLGPPGRVRVIARNGGCPSVPCYHPDDPPHPGMTLIKADDVFPAAKELIERDHER